MTHPFKQMCDVQQFRNGMLDSLAMRHESSVQDMAASMCVGWPSLALMWPDSTVGRDVVDICMLADKTRGFVGIETPPFVGASRFALLCMGVETVHIKKSFSTGLGHRLDIDIGGDSLHHFDAKMNTAFGNHWPGFEVVVNGAILAGARDSTNITVDWHLPSGRFFTRVAGSAMKGRTYISSSNEISHCEWVTKNLLEAARA